VITLVSVVPEVVYVFSGQTPFDVSAAEVARTGRAVGWITRMVRVMRMMQIVASLTTIFIKFRGSKKNMFGICPLKFHHLYELLRLWLCIYAFYLFLTYAIVRGPVDD
jgi:hypothetical protein